MQAGWRPSGGDDSELRRQPSGCPRELFKWGPAWRASTPAAVAAAEVKTLVYTRFEKARIVGARALQVSMGAPPLIEVPEEVRDPVQVALREYEADAIPLTVQRTKTHQVNA